MQKTEAAMILAGVTPEEQRQASAPTNLHVITGTVTGKSSSGKTQVSVDGLIFTADNSQHIEIDTLGGLEEGDVATILLTGENGHGMTPLAVGAPGSIDRIDVRIKSIEADYVKATLLEAEVAKFGYLSADSAVIQDLEAGKAYIDDLTANNITAARIVANSAYIKDLELDGITADEITAAAGYIDDLTTNNITTDKIEAASGYIDDLTAANITASDISADHATVGQLDTTYATIGSLNAEQARVDNLLVGKASVADLTAANGRIDTLQSTKADISVLESDYITANAIDATYLHADMSNADVAWIQNGIIKDGSISNAMINSLSANKLTAGTINGETINVTNINADNITAGTINGQRIGQGSLSLDKLSEDVYTEQEVDNKLSTMQAEIDGAIETWTGTAVPTLNNSPASNWTTAAVRDTHVGDVYFVVNSQSEQNGYNYRFTKSGTTYSWQLIKDSDVTNALQRISTAEGKITTFGSDISTLKTDTGTLKTKTTDLETRMSDAEDDILDKVSTTTFNEVSDTVDQHSQTITQMSQTLSNKADGSTVTSLTQRVSKNEQDISGINTTIGELSTTVESKADGSTVESVSNRLNTVSNTVDGHTQSITNITSTQTTMQGKLDKTIVESMQLWYTKADTTAPSKPTSQVTSTSTSGGAWRTVVPAYNLSYPNYFYCYQWKYSDGTYGWSAVTRDIAMGESQSTSRTAASDASTAKATADKNVKSSVQLWYTKADETAPSKPTSKVTSTAVSGNGWRTVVPTYSSSYPNYFYCYQYELADGTYTWSDVVFDRATTENQSNSRGAVSGVSTLTSRTNEISNTVDGHTTQLSSITETQTTIQGSAVKSTVQLWFTKANTTAPSKPTAHVTTNNASTANAWNLAVPTYNSNYPYYYYCYEHQLLNDTYTWSAVTRDIATEESQSTSRSAKATADKNVKESQQLWYTKANSTAPAKPTSKITSTATTGGAWTTRVPTYSDDYKHYFYCMQYVAADGTVTWSDVVYDQATTEAQSVARTASADLTEFHQDYATFKQTTQQFESSIGNTYATKGALETVDGKVSSLTTRVSTAETNITQNATNITLKAKKMETIDGNMLYDVDAPNLTKIFGPANRYFSDSGNASFMVCDIRAVTDSPATGIEYMAHWSVSGSSANKQRGLCFYNGNYTQFVTGQKYILSCWVRCTSGKFTYCNNAYATAFPSNSGARTIDSSVDSGWQFVTTTVTATKTQLDRVYFMAKTLSDSLAFECDMCGFKMVPAAYATQAELKIANDEIDARVEKNGVISAINLSGETAKIQASRVEIDGAAVFNAAKSKLDAAYDSKGSAQTVQNNLDNLEIGGRNLLLKSVDLSKGSPLRTNLEVTRYGSSSTFVDVDGKYFGVSTSAAWQGIYVFADSLDLSVGDLVTFSCRIRTTSITGTVQYYTMAYNSSGTRTYPNTKNASSAEPTFTTGNAKKLADLAANSDIGVWLTMEWTQEAETALNNGEAFRMSFQTYSNLSGNGTIIFYAPKLEKGNKATDWSPAPEDLQSNSVRRTQRIWYRKSVEGVPATPGTASSDWVVKADDGSNAWTKMHIAISSTEKFIYTCEQYEMGDGTVGYTSVLLDNTITVIDGGKIITGSVSANAVSATSGTFAEANIPNLSASKITTGTIAIGRIPDAAKNENIVVGGRNLLLATSDPKELTTTTSDTNKCSYYNFSEYGYSTVHGSGLSTVMVSFDWETTGTSGMIRVQTNASPWSSAIAVTISSTQQSGHASLLMTVPSTWATTTFDGFGVRLDNIGGTTTIKNFKMEVGNKATDWSPAPEDVTYDINTISTAMSEANEGLANSIAEVSNSLEEANTRITNLTNAVADADADRAKWVRVDSENGITIGAVDSSYNLVLDNNSVDFMVGDQLAATASIDAFIPTALRLGDYVLSGSGGYLYIDYQPLT